MIGRLLSMLGMRSRRFGMFGPRGYGWERQGRRRGVVGLLPLAYLVWQNRARIGAGLRRLRGRSRHVGEVDTGLGIGGAPRTV